MYKPYVGITGFMSSSEVSGLVNKIDPRLFAKRDLMVGVLASSKTLAGQPNKWPGRYPRISDLINIFTGDEHCLNLVHFNYQTGQTGTCSGTLSEELSAVQFMGGNYCHGIQLNMAWPDIDEIVRFRNRHRSKRFVLQIGGQALNEVNCSTTKLFERLTSYVQPIPDNPERRLITDILIDPSGGTGTLPQSLDIFFKLADNVNKRDLNIGVGYVGGLCVERLSHIGVYYKRMPNISIDAEGQLRTPKDDPANNQLDHDKAYAYLINALAMSNPEAI